MLFKRKEPFSEREKEEIVQVIRKAERLTSGEIRVFVEHHCRFVNAMDRAREIFVKLQMHQTQKRNGVLLYVALKDHQFAILGDEGIHSKVGDHFWRQQAIELRKNLAENKFVAGIAHCAGEIGTSLERYFPYESGDDNELSDDIVFGR